MNKQIDLPLWITQKKHEIHYYVLQLPHLYYEHHKKQQHTAHVGQVKAIEKISMKYIPMNVVMTTDKIMFFDGASDGLFILTPGTSMHMDTHTRAGEGKGNG